MGEARDKCHELNPVLSVQSGYISLVTVCPICGAPGKQDDVRAAAEDFTRRYEFQRLWETGTFEQVWDAITPRV
jgi:hypothetical protein